MVDKVANEAAKIMRENPGMKFYQAIIEAKKIIKKEKGPIAGKQNKSLEK